MDYISDNMADQSPPRPKQLPISMNIPKNFSIEPFGQTNATLGTRMGKKAAL
jgi:hypothetical protein